MSVFVWTPSDVFGLIVLLVIAATLIPMWIADKYRKWRKRK